jgi:Response regulator containing CheY-like receiver, AAA-type ATPase, and DNA-binding domains
MERYSRSVLERAAIHECKQTTLLLSEPHATILVVEDEPFVRSATCELLDSLGYHALSAEDASSAKKIFADLDEQINLLVCDAVLPDGNGIELAEFLCAICPGLKVVVVSGYPEATLKKLGAEHAVHFLSKPYTAGLLISKIEIALNSDAHPLGHRIPDPAARVLSGVR